MSSTPTLGCQIAPHYDRDRLSIDSSSLSTNGSDEEEITKIGEREEAVKGVDIEKAEMQRDDVTIMTASQPTILRGMRTRSSKKEATAAPVGFWHWKMAGVRLHVLKLWMRTNLILGLAIFSFLCLFWGALFRQNDNVKLLGVWVVDFDGQIPPYENVKPFVGPFVRNSIQSLVDSPGTHPGFTIRQPSDFDNDPLKVRQSVFDFHAWAAVIINANATALLDVAVRDGNASYDPLGACQIIYNSARDQTVSSSYIIPSMTTIQKLAVSEFGRSWLTHLLRNVSATDLNLDVSPQAISPGIGFTMYDLRPFGPPIATPAVSIGLIYLIILSFFSFTFFLPIHMKYISPRGHPPLIFQHLIIWRYCATVVSYLLLSLIYSLVSLAFLMPMNRPKGSQFWPSNNSNAYGMGTFPMYWLVNWIGMTALGLASENMAMLLGTPWTALWLVFWVISNVATGFYSLPLASGFYRWGYAWPVHNIAEITRQILFDLHPRTGLNFSVLLVWCAVGTALFPLCCYYMRWNTLRANKGAAKRESEWHEKMEKGREEPSFLARVTTAGSSKKR